MAECRDIRTEPSVGDILYRRTVSNVFLRLSRTDIQQIAYVRLKGREDTKKFSAANQQAASLDLMESLEEYGFFSRKNVKGLIEVLKDSNRTDLVEEIERILCKPSKTPVNSAASPTEESASGLGDSRQKTNDQGRGQREVVSKRLTPLPSPRCGGGRGPYHKETTLASSSTSVGKGGGQKKVPLLPPTLLKKATQETASQSKIPVIQQLVTIIKPQGSPPTVARRLANTPPSKSAPPPPPPKNKRSEHTDSGFWSGGSAYDTINEWTKHHENRPAGALCADVGGAALYQHLDGIDDHQYTTPGTTKHNT